MHFDSQWGYVVEFFNGTLSALGICYPVGDMLSGTVPGRKDQNEITLYESVGSAVLDLAIAVETYRQISKSTKASTNI
jgi:ornithine cyclodeaminase/alanine dehydrogenase-like protein (mu-crystallin family)